MSKYSRSAELHARAQRVLAGGVSSEFRKFNAPHPLFYSHGAGSYIVDVDENKYLDFTLSQGPLILGHNHPHVNACVEQASREGQLYAGQHLRELELAERVQQYVPCAELIRFSLSGSEAAHAAIRVARAVTGRTKFIRFEGQYHGWLDNVAYAVNGATDVLGPREQPTPVVWSQGLPPNSRDEFIVLPWNDLALVEHVLARHHTDVAAIITEPVMCNSGCIEAGAGFLEGLRQLCDTYDVALIFDEVITGFRLGLGGAQAYFGVTPDLAVFAKALANGFPLSALVGKRRWMQPIADGTVIHAGTLNANVSSVAAALATLDVLAEDGMYEQLFARGRRLMDGLRATAQELDMPVLVQGLGPMFHMGFTDAEAVRDYRDTLRYNKAHYAMFVRLMQDRGVRLIGRGLWYISAVHTDAEITHALVTAKAVLQEMRNRVD